MSTNVNAKVASQTQRIFFKSAGGTYSAIFMSKQGDLYQEYEGPVSNPTAYYPDFTKTGAARQLSIIVASSTGTGVAQPKSVVYTVAENELAFDQTGKCTRVGTSTDATLCGKFKLDTTTLGLIIQGNIATIAGGASFLIQCKAIMDDTGNQFIIAKIPFNVAPYNAASPGRFTIASDDNYTIYDKGGTCTLKALFSQKGNEQLVNAKWEQLINGTWDQKAASAQTYVVKEEDVQTYSLFRATYNNGGEDFTDTQGVQDVSDPLDIITTVLISKDGTSTPVATTDLEVLDDLPDDAYLLFRCSLVVRGSTSALAATWQPTAQLVNAAGVNMMPIALINGNEYKVTIKNLRDCGGIGQYELTYTGEQN